MKPADISLPVQFLVAGEDGKNFIECLRRGGAILVPPDKSRIFAFLAATRTPHVSVGVAAMKGIWGFDHEAFGPMRSFLANLLAAQKPRICVSAQ